MFKKIKFSVFNVFVAVLLAMTSFFTINALRIDRLNLNPLFALVCFVLAFLLISIRLLIEYLSKDIKKANIAVKLLLAIISLIFLFFCFMLLDMYGFFNSN